MTHICLFWLKFKGILHKWKISIGYESDHDHDRGHVGMSGSFSVKFNENSEN